MKHRVVFSPEAGEQLAALYRYIAAASSGEIAARYTEAIVSYCERLGTFPIRGVQRDDEADVTAPEIFPDGKISMDDGPLG